MLMAERMVCVSGDYALSVSDARGRFWINVVESGGSVTLPVPRPKEMTETITVSNFSVNLVTVMCQGHLADGSDGFSLAPNKVAFLRAVFNGTTRQWVGSVMDSLTYIKTENRVNHESAENGNVVVPEPVIEEKSRKKRK